MQHGLSIFFPITWVKYLQSQLLVLWLPNGAKVRKRLHFSYQRLPNILLQQLPNILFQRDNYESELAWLQHGSMV